MPGASATPRCYPPFAIQADQLALKADLHRALAIQAVVEVVLIVALVRLLP